MRSVVEAIVVHELLIKELFAVLSSQLLLLMKKLQLQPLHPIPGVPRAFACPHLSTDVCGEKALIFSASIITH